MTNSPDETWNYAAKAMAWYGWGSPIGLAVFLIGLGGFFVLVRFAVFGV